ncbi:MAG TPA: hypothetical protein PKZ16_03150 [bacterium]|nr:hypothetical protein [bacterium]HPL95349.1 hypothetical protein [bacterium]
MNQNQLIELKQYIETAEIAINQAKDMIDLLGGNEKNLNKIAKKRARALTPLSEDNDTKSIEGVFNGQHMIGTDGKEYSIPANYASKSKLVAGDQMKLTIQPDGTFIYKQTKPIEQERLTGTIITTEDGYAVISGDGRKFNVLTASITYFKGQPGDTAVILVPVDYPSLWAAVENVIKKVNNESETNLTQPTLEAPPEEMLPPVKTNLLETEEHEELPSGELKNNPSPTFENFTNDQSLSTPDHNQKITAPKINDSASNELDIVSDDLEDL